jgi:hypothetical protein
MKPIRFLFSIALSVSTAQAQLLMPPLSPSGTISQQIGYTTIEIDYDRPAARGRSEENIFGKLVPWGSVWRTGAGPGTKITFSTAVTIGGKDVAKGTYALFTIPDKDEWTIIINTDTAAYAVFRYDQKNDLVRVRAKPQRSPRYYESLTFDIEFIPNNARIYISWLNTQLSFDVKTGTDEKVMAYILDNLIDGDSKNPQDYEIAVIYYQWHNLDLDMALKFVDKGMKLQQARWWYHFKIGILEKQKKYQEAIQAARDGIVMVSNTPEEQGVDKKELIRDFEQKIDELTRTKHVPE